MCTIVIKYMLSEHYVHYTIFIVVLERAKRVGGR